jgi:hypothetical protein
MKHPLLTLIDDLNELRLEMRHQAKHASSDEYREHFKRQQQICVKAIEAVQSLWEYERIEVKWE